MIEKTKTQKKYAGYVAFDTETTGLSEKATVLTASFVFLDLELKVIAEKDFVFSLDRNKEMSISLQAMEINQINLLEQLNNKEAVHFDRANVELYELVKEYADSYWLPIGKNYQFDVDKLKPHMSFVSKQIDRTGIDVGSNHVLLKAMGIVPIDVGNKLTDIANYYGLSTEKAHNANVDTWLTIEVLKKQMSALRSLSFDSAARDVTPVNQAV